jgi:hypothetical protein
MKDSSNDQRQNRAENARPVPQLALRTDLRAGADADCELGVGYWRRELNSWRKIAEELGCA